MLSAPKNVWIEKKKLEEDFNVCIGKERYVSV